MDDTPPASRLVVLISGTGRNLQAIIEAIDAGQINARITHVFCNRDNAPGLSRAWQAGIATSVVAPRAFDSREAHDAALADQIDGQQPDWVVLAGYMRILSSDFVKRFQGRLLNIHPSLLPKHKGLETHSKALEAGDERHGATVHFVTEELDGGPGIIQGSIAVREDDDANSLSQRLMTTVETRIYPQALKWASDGRLEYRDNKVFLDGEALSAPIHEAYDED